MQKDNENGKRRKRVHFLDGNKPTILIKVAHKTALGDLRCHYRAILRKIESNMTPSVAKPTEARLHYRLRQRIVNGLFRASASYLMLDVDTVHSAITLFDQVQAVVPYYKLGIADWWDKLPTGFYLEDDSVHCLAW